MKLKSGKSIGKLLQYFGLTAILLFVFSTRLFELGKPSEFVFDERYHVPAIQLIADQDIRAFDWWHSTAIGGKNIYGDNNHDWLHPPLAKYIQAEFLLDHDFLKEQFKQEEENDLRAENYFFNLRLPAVIFGALGIILVFCLTQILFKDFRISLLAALILALDGLWLVQSRLATNDIFVSVFTLGAILSFVLFLQKKYLEYLPIVGLMIGLALATKWSASWIWLAIWMYLLIDFIKNNKMKTRQKIKQLPWLIFSLGLVPICIYLSSYSALFREMGFGQGWQHFLQLHKNILLYQFGRGDFHPYASGPMQWFLNLRPVWYWTQDLGLARADIYALGNPVISLLGIGVVLGLIMNWGKKISNGLSLILYFYLASFLPWIFSPRILFYYHYTIAVPLLAILLSWWIFKKHQKWMIVGLVILMIVSFWIFYPHWLGIPVSKQFAEAVYFALPSWR